MTRRLISLTDLGEEQLWLLVRQARGIPDAKMRSDHMSERTAMLVFARDSFIDRLCVSAAVRQMGGSTIYQDISRWEDVHDYQQELMCQLGYFVDCMYCYGLPESTWAETDWSLVDFPIINAGGFEGRPTRVLADVACMLRHARDGRLGDVRVAWVGCPNGVLFSLIEGTKFFPYRLRVALPPEAPEGLVEAAATRHGARVEIFSDPKDAVADADFVYAGRRLCGDDGSHATWMVTADLMAAAKSDAHLLMGANPIRSIYVDPSILRSPASLLLRQAENHLRIHKRILHWVFEDR